MKNELEKQENGDYVWNLMLGKKYWLGYPSGIGEESVFARYFGILDGKYIFFREKDGETLRYSCETSECTAVWYSEYSEGPWQPAIPAHLDRDVIKGHEKEYIMNRLAGKKHVI